MPALRKMADETGIKFNRISDLLRQKNGTPTLQEFTTLCLLFGERPSRVLERVMQTIEQNERATNTTTALADGPRSPAVSDPAVEAASILYQADNGIDIDAWADRIKAEDSVHNL